MARAPGLGEAAAVWDDARAVSEGHPAPVHAISVARGLLVLTPMPGSAGDYAADLRHLLDLSPAFVLSLATASELHAGHAERFGMQMRERGCRWMHLPVPDSGVPQRDFELAWPESSIRMRKALSGGGRVVVQCRAGAGRSGMVALRLLVETGEAPDVALKRLREVHPAAIETDAQLAWAQAGVPNAPLERPPVGGRVRKVITSRPANLSSQPTHPSNAPRRRD